MELFFQILLVFLLIFINAYFVASELALVSIRRTRIEELVKKGNKTARKINKALKHLDRYISATQFGITVISILLGWIGEPIIADLIEKTLFVLPEHLATMTAHTVAVIVGFILITFIDIVFGELLPKNIALQRTERIAFITITPLTLFAKIFLPFISILTNTSNFLLRLMGFSETAKKQVSHSEDEIKIILSQSAQSGQIERGEAEMVYKVFRIADLPVQAIMIPQQDIIAFEVSQGINDIITELQKNSHSRFPIYNKTLHNVIGFLHVKDIYKLAIQPHENIALSQTSIIREIIRVPETKRVDDLILEMRKKRIHLALVVDKKDKTVGIVTLEDLLESIVGEIQDEFEKPEKIS
ncbi:MAG TPA: hemolysin family protein [Candidatus Saccharimonadales bacterium]|nr:hemolysin family protein [Candidatus Saccharimonadales bacterium]